MNIPNDYRSMFRTIADTHGTGITKSIRRDAQHRLDLLTAAYPDIPKGERRHVYGYIFPRIAVYRAAEQQLGPETTSRLLADTIDQQGRKAGSMLRRLTALPLMKGLFMRIFASMAKSMFGERGGFRQTFYASDRNTVRFDILDCTYCRWCRKCGCPEIIHTFCVSDEHCFGHLTGIDFVRTETLENGSKCDFALTRRKGERPE